MFLRRHTHTRYVVIKQANSWQGRKRCWTSPSGNMVTMVITDLMVNEGCYGRRTEGLFRYLTMCEMGGKRECNHRICEMDCDGQKSSNVRDHGGFQNQVDQMYWGHVLLSSTETKTVIVSNGNPLFIMGGYCSADRKLVFDETQFNISQGYWTYTNSYSFNYTYMLLN